MTKVIMLMFMIFIKILRQNDDVNKKNYITIHSDELVQKLYFMRSRVR